MAQPKPPLRAVLLATPDDTEAQFYEALREADLDEGPIIEQDVERVDHALSPEDYTAVGRDVECVVLARAVRWHVEHRVLMNPPKTVVFR